MSCGGETLLMLTLSVVIVLGQLTDTLAQSTAAEEGVERNYRSSPAATTSPPPSPPAHHTTTRTNSNIDPTDSEQALKPPTKVIEAFEKSLLKMFGLSSRPRPSRKVHIPQHMLDLYNDRVKLTQGPGESYHVQDTNIYSANTIRSYLHSEGESD